MWDLFLVRGCLLIVVLVDGNNRLRQLKVGGSDVGKALFYKVIRKYPSLFHTAAHGVE